MGILRIHIKAIIDQFFNEIIETKITEETRYSDSVLFTVGTYGIEEDLAEFRYYAVDNAGNAEEIHYQNHYVSWDPR